MSKKQDRSKRKKRLTIAIVSPGTFSVPPVVGSSVEHDIEMVANELRQKHRVIVYTRRCKEYPRSSRIGTLEYRRVAYDHWRSYLRKVVRDLKTLKPDIIQVENRPKYIHKIRAKFPDTPIVLNMHSMQFASKPHIAPDKVEKALGNIDALLTNSHYLKQEYVRRFPLASKKTYAVHLGIDTMPFERIGHKKRALRKLRKKYGLKRNDAVLLFAGRLKKEKGVHHLLRALPALLKKRPNVKLLIAGSPKYGNNKPTAYAKKIYKMAQGLKHHVVFTDFIKPHEMPRIYQLADIVVTPSVWGEPFCRVNLEAMASALPVVTTRRGGIPEVVKDGHHGYVLPLKGLSKTLPRTLIKLLQSKKKRKTFGENAYQAAKTFTWQKTADQYASVYASLLE